MTPAMSKTGNEPHEAIEPGPSQGGRSPLRRRRDVVFVTICLWSETARLRAQSRL
jgi:hypothetical protein